MAIRYSAHSDRTALNASDGRVGEDSIRMASTTAATCTKGFAPLLSLAIFLILLMPSPVVASGGPRELDRSGGF